MPTTTELDMWKYLEQEEGSLDPRDVTPYLNTVLKTMNKTYYIDWEGKMNWDPGMKLKKRVKLIVGVKHSDYHKVTEELDIEEGEFLTASMEELVQVMHDYGKPINEKNIEEGVHMMFLLESGDAEKSLFNLFKITSRIMKMYPLPDEGEN
jgi:hypothetical protein